MIVAGFLLLLVYANAAHQKPLKAEDVTVVVVSQADSYNSHLAQELKNSIIHQANTHELKHPKIYLAHNEFSHPGAWTIVPLLPKLFKKDENSSSWFIFCEERTRINLQTLVSELANHNPSKEVWLGYGLYDKEPTIIHHFAFSDGPVQLKYPLLAAGFAVSSALLKRLAKDAASIQKSDFSIDAMHEFAVFTKTELSSFPNIFCVDNKTSCASYVLPFTPCGEALQNEDLFFAVKTCLKHHLDRVPVVKQTWAQSAVNIEFFSDVKDESIPTTAVGVANTERGHCAKTLAILRLAAERFEQSANLEWFVLADDDTLLSVPRLQALLSCWKGEEVVVGERYGYNVLSALGYNYPTGGGGIAISRALLPTLALHCRCQADNSPDDMYLGFCLARLNKTLVHSPFFHQARPTDYAAGYLASQLPVSFHKHWMLDPVSTYKQWFSSGEQTSSHLHTEF